jgi:hypothetical protein
VPAAAVPLWWALARAACAADAALRTCSIGNPLFTGISIQHVGAHATGQSPCAVSHATFSLRGVHCFCKLCGRQWAHCWCAWLVKEAAASMCCRLCWCDSPQPCSAAAGGMFTAMHSNNPTVFYFVRVHVCRGCSGRVGGGGGGGTGLEETGRQLGTGWWGCATPRRRGVDSLFAHTTSTQQQLRVMPAVS